MKMRLLKGLLLIFFLLSGVVVKSQHKLNIFLDSVKANVPSTMWGIFIEDINFAADGGLYAELVKNRSFEFEKPLMGWKVETRSEFMPRILVIKDSANKNNAHFARLTTDREHPFSIVNEGFRGIGIKKGEQYRFSFLLRNLRPCTVNVTILNKSGSSLGVSKVEIKNTSTSWTRYRTTITANDSTIKGSLRLEVSGEGDYDIDMISLMPVNTWKKRENGLRPDLVQLLADLKPGFVRFPGGCIVEGMNLDNRYQWKNTVGNIEDRKLEINRWNKEFARRQAPDYFQSYGLGFYEYFLLSEDLGAEPLPILNCGMACQYNTAEVAPVTELDPYVQDALDLIEFANGDTTTIWGRLRAKMGHPKPFNLKMLGIGNEQWGPQYIDRMLLFKKALKTNYPNVKLVYSTGTSPSGERFEYLNDTLRKLNSEILDEHYYQKPEWFLSNASRYDSYSRNGTEVFAGEYAVRSDSNTDAPRRNNWEGALCEAAFMTGLERNADIVTMASYAPLLAHVDAWQWTPDLIWFDNLNVYPTPDYFVQKMFSINKGTMVVASNIENVAESGKDSLYASAVVDVSDNSAIIKIVNTAAHSQNISINAVGKRKLKSVINITQLSSGNLMDHDVVPETVDGIMLKKGRVATDIPARSFYIVRLALK